MAELLGEERGDLAAIRWELDGSQAFEEIWGVSLIELEDESPAQGADLGVLVDLVGELGQPEPHFVQLVCEEGFEVSVVEHAGDGDVQEAPVDRVDLELLLREVDSFHVGELVVHLCLCGVKHYRAPIHLLDHLCQRLWKLNHKAEGRPVERGDDPRGLDLRLAVGLDAADEVVDKLSSGRPVLCLLVRHLEDLERHGAARAGDQVYLFHLAWVDGRGHVDVLGVWNAVLVVGVLHLGGMGE